MTEEGSLTESAARGGSPRGPRWARRAFVGLIAFFTAWCVGQVFRDVTWVTGLCFYIPSPVLAALLILAAGLDLVRPGTLRWAPNRTSRWARSRFIAASWALLGVAPILVVVFVENRFDAGRPFPPDDAARGDGVVRLVHWNVYEGERGWEGVVDVMRGTQADIFVLSELPKDRGFDEILADFGAGFDGIRVATMGVIVRNGSASREFFVRGGKVYVAAARCDFGSNSIEVLAVDLPSSPMRARDPYLNEVIGAMRATEPDVVVGDFNAPRRSRTLEPPPDGYQHAYDTHGSGWSYTWPLPCPVYALDQCLYSERVEPLRYELRSSEHSDHRLQVFDFRVVTKG